jgi:hypothetical protein
MSKRKRKVWIIEYRQNGKHHVEAFTRMRDADDRLDTIAYDLLNAGKSEPRHTMRYRVDSQL